MTPHSALALPIVREVVPADMETLVNFTLAWHGAIPPKNI